ncbi:MAG: anti-sigma factor [Polaromonas sp.]|uniref:anti-sigma factor n=1 Tax=Polaromonas sp. TaxID=1869339 RepID=UPI00272FF563|nr:anti-sigma factor [Polaromonas sp.]MDP2450910.1 anti-sigma factor [Polaromonas sp.]MDP3247375.1 anti-sigma factor [Polaromonas sp.]MDP3756835.1 anti-sigma factor [Polaromonas sp.]
MRYTSPDLLEHLASSYVLGTLGGGARRRFERLQRDRADVRVRVTQWEARLGQLAVSVPVQQPSPQLWKTIAARTQPAASAVAPDAPPRSWLGWLKPAGFGFGGLAAGVMVASVLYVTAPGLFMSSDQIAMRTGEKLPPSYVGLLTDAQGNGKLLVSSLRHGKTMTVKVIGQITPPAGGTLVLWAVPASGPAFALGPVPTSGSAVSMLPDTSEKLLSKVGKLVVTLETDAAPAAPSGPVVFSGNCAKLW